jgi:KaiC/GvpD/RAD55 family RecA-like ATPase
MSDPNKQEALRIPIISDILGQPVARGRIIVVLYEPSTQWLSLILTIASGLLGGGYTVAITTIVTAPARVRQLLAVALPNLTEVESAKRLTLIDWYTWMTGKKSTERRSVDSLALAQFNIQDSGFQRDDSPLYDFLATDNYSAFLKYNDERSFMQWLDKTIARMREFKGVRMYGFMKGFHSDAFYANLESMADGVIELNINERANALENVIRVKTMKSEQHSTEWRTLKITTTGFLTLTPKRR